MQFYKFYQNSQTTYLRLKLTENPQAAARQTIVSHFESMSTEILHYAVYTGSGWAKAPYVGRLSDGWLIFRHILQTCHLPIDHLTASPADSSWKILDDEQLSHAHHRKRSKAKEPANLTLTQAVQKLHKESLETYASYKFIDAEIQKSLQQIYKRYGLSAIDWQHNWHPKQLRPCLTELKRVLEHLLTPGPGSLALRAALQGANLRFGSDGCYVSVDGWLNLDVADASEEWMQAVRSSLFQPTNTRALEHQLRIIIGDVNFMPAHNVPLVRYVAWLKVLSQRLTIAPLSKQSDWGYVSMRGACVRVENETGSLFVSRDGILCIPCNTGSAQLASFLRQNVPLAQSLFLEHSKLKEHVEELKETVRDRLELHELTVDDQLPLSSLADCLERLTQLKCLEAKRLHIGRKYSVLYDGRIAIPVDWKSLN